MKISLAVLAILCLAFFGFQQFKIYSLHKEIKKTQSIIDKQIEVNRMNAKEEHYELAVAMARMQAHMQKLHFAGQNENWKLAKFYTHEIKETMNEIIDHKVTKNGKDIGNLIQTMSYPNIEKLQKTIKSEDKTSFVEGYELLLRSCNNCHVAINYEFIRITTPKNEDAINQDFK